jgi:hypothetical protein
MPFNRPLIDILDFQLARLDSRNDFLQRMRNFLMRCIRTTHIENGLVVIPRHILHLEKVGKDVRFEEGLFPEDMNRCFIMV